MKFLPLIWSALWRKRGRTILIFLQVGVAFALFGVLQGLKTGVEHAIAASRADLLIVHSRLNFFAEPLPLGLLPQIESVPGVEKVIPVDIFMGTYQKPDQKVGIVAVSPEKGWQSAFTFVIPSKDAAAFRATRTAALARAGLVRKYGWKIGEQIPLRSNVMKRDGSPVWTFDLVGTFGDTDLVPGANHILIHYGYLNEARLIGRDTVQHFNVKISNPKMAATVEDAIDARFANSSHETLTQSLRGIAQMQLQQIGDVNFLIRAVIGAALFAMLFATATMLIQSVRERTWEIAVLKTVGFTGRTVFALIVAEAVVICIPAAAFGLALATFVFPYASRVVHGLSMPWIVVAVGLGSALLVAVVSAAVPAAFAARLEVATALAEQ